MNDKSKSTLINAIALCSCGVAIGWIVGLSVSPIIEKVVEAVLGIAATVIATLAGVKVATKSIDSTDDNLSKDASNNHSEALRLQVNAIPIAGFSVFLAIGASFGLMARTNDWFAPSPSGFAKRWQKETGVDRQILAKVLLSSLYPDVMKEEIRGKVASMALSDSKEVQKAGLPEILKYIYPQNTPGPTNLHPGGDVGLKSDQETLEKCSKIDVARRDSTQEFNDVNIASLYFNSELRKCVDAKGGEKSCAVQILKDRCP